MEALEAFDVKDRTDKLPTTLPANEWMKLDALTIISKQLKRIEEHLIELKGDAFI